MANQTTDNNGIALIKEFEGFSKKIYKDSVGKETVGYGHLVRFGEDFSKGISEAEAEELLRQDLKKAEYSVRNNVKVPLTQNQFNALVSFTFNLGSAALEDSTLLKKLNRSEYASVPKELNKWVHGRINGKLVPLKGLVKRRKMEGILFETK